MDNTVTSFRACFSTDPGRRVLGQILLDAGYFDADIKSDGDQAVLNFVKKCIIKKLGIFNGPENVDSYVNKLFELPSEL